MENNGTEKDRQIQLVLNTPGQAEEDSIDLGRVFHNMKLKARVFAWVLVLCLVAGVCAPLVLYQVKHPELTVSTVATLDYELQYSWEDLLEMAETKKEQERIAQGQLANDITMLFRQVADLTAPDLTALDLNQVTSAYVLNNALDGLTLSQNLDAETLRRNITIQRILSEESRRQQELLSGMIDSKDSDAYKQAQDMQLTYSNQFIVKLKNGFGDEDSKVILDLEDDELRTLLNRIMVSYNDYLVRTYADTRLPTDEISIIDTDEMDVLESLEQLRKAEQNLYAYCYNKSIQEKAYRSAVTGHTLTDWMEALQTVADTHIDYLYSYVYAEGIAQNPAELVSNYEYQLTNARLSLDETMANIAETKEILDSYKNDKIFVSIQESDGSRGTTDTTAYYNQLVEQQAYNYTTKRSLETTIADLEKKIARLLNTESTDLGDVKEELDSAIQATYAIYQAVYAHMQEIQEGTEFLNYVRHTEAQGRMDNFIVANLKMIILGAVAGAVIACGLWFLAALAPEFRRDDRKEAARA